MLQEKRMTDKNKECKTEVGGLKKYKKDQNYKENGNNKKEEKK